MNINTDTSLKNDNVNLDRCRCIKSAIKMNTDMKNIFKRCLLT